MSNAFAISNIFQPNPIFTKEFMADCVELGQYTYADPQLLSPILETFKKYVYPQASENASPHVQQLQLQTYLKNEMCHILSGRVANTSPPAFLNTYSDVKSYLFHSEKDKEPLITKIIKHGEGAQLGGRGIVEILGHLKSKTDLMTLLHFAVLEQRSDFVQDLLKVYKGVEPLNDKGYSPLHYSSKNAVIAELLLKSGANINRPVDDGRTLSDEIAFCYDNSIRSGSIEGNRCGVPFLEANFNRFRFEGLLQTYGALEQKERGALFQAKWKAIRIAEKYLDGNIV